MIPTLPQLRRLVGNPDAYAVQLESGAYAPVREPLTDAVLGKHLQRKQTVGTYIGHRIGGQTVARTLVFDIDNGEHGDAERIVVALGELGVRVNNTGIENSGKKGYHVWVPLQEYHPNHELRRLGRAVLAVAGVSCEVYPKQDEVRDLGNLVKLPGGVHQVSKVVAQFETVPLPLPTVRWEALMAELPEEIRARGSSTGLRFPCMELIQEGVEDGQNRNNALYHLAAMLRRSGLNEENVEWVVRKTNDLGDPLEDYEVDALLESSKTSGPICTTLLAEQQCGEQCIRVRAKGLSTRRHQLRYAAEGEPVVVEVTGRNGNIVEFSHPDVGNMKARLNGD